MFAVEPASFKNPAVEERRLGRVAYSDEFIKASPSRAIQNLFMKLIPLKVEYDYPAQAFNMVAFSDEFDPVEPGAPIPEYQITVRVVGSTAKKTNKRVAYYIVFTKIEQSSLAELLS